MQECGARIYFKREDLTGSHKINNVRQAPAARMGKTRIIAELVPGTEPSATAALMGLNVYMGDTQRAGAERCAYAIARRDRRPG